MHQKRCSGCEALDIADPLERAHRLLDLRVASGGYDHHGPLMKAIEEASRQCVNGERDPRTVGRTLVIADAQALAEEIVDLALPLDRRNTLWTERIRAIIERAAGRK